MCLNLGRKGMGMSYMKYRISFNIGRDLFTFEKELKDTDTIITNEHIAPIKVGVASELIKAFMESDPQIEKDEEGNPILKPTNIRMYLICGTEETKLLSIEHFSEC